MRSNPKYVRTLLILSGISLGLAIFTKIPAFTMVPLVAYLIYQNIDIKKFTSNREVKGYIIMATSCNFDTNDMAYIRPTFWRYK